MGSDDREAIGYDHGYDGEIFYVGLALDKNSSRSHPHFGILRETYLPEELRKGRLAYGDSHHHLE